MILEAAIRKAQTNARCQVQIGGPALRIDARQLGSMFDASKEIRHLFLRYWDAVMFQYKLRSAIQGTRYPRAADACSKFTIG